MRSSLRSISSFTKKGHNEEAAEGSDHPVSEKEKLPEVEIVLGDTKFQLEGNAPSDDMSSKANGIVDYEQQLRVSGGTHSVK